ncbi:MAG: DUF3794 domain-containing protein [Oscillospiraceae bacterium]|nr:DUF3794 domain-containing protein [Oscillospiraceae bacterium]
MELELKRQPIAACEPLLNAVAEHSIECDVLLPDHCPDIVKLICCRIDSVITGCAAHKSVFTVEGMATARICYIGEIGGVRKTEYKLPFSKSFDMRGEARRPVWSVETGQSKTNCRAVSKRRIEISGAITITARLFDTASQQAVCEAEGMGVRLRCCQTPAADLTGQILRQFSVTEILNPMPGMPPAAEVVMADCRIMAQDSRITASRILIKGDMAVHLLYKDDSDPPKLLTADYTLPLSQVIDGDDLQEDMLCETAVKCVSCECVPEEFGDDGQLRLEVRAAADIKLFRPITLSGAVDSYSTLYPTKNTLSQIKTLKNCTPFSQKATVKTRAEMPQGMTMMQDCWAQVIERTTKMTDDGATMALKLLFTAIAATEESEAQPIEHIAEAQVMINGVSPQSELFGSVNVVSVSGMMEQGGITLECELLINGMAMEFELREFLTELLVDTDSPRAADPLLGLMVYYAAAGEDVWDIAKRFGSLPEQIMADNDLSSQLLESDMPLMIPTV